MAYKHDRPKSKWQTASKKYDRLRIEAIKWLNRDDVHCDLGRDFVENRMVGRASHQHRRITDKNIRINRNIRFKFAGNWHKLCASPFWLIAALIRRHHSHTECGAAESAVFIQMNQIEIDSFVITTASEQTGLHFGWTMRAALWFRLLSILCTLAGNEFELKTN